MINSNEIVPLLIRRSCGGWLALSPDTCGLKIGVIGETEGEAQIKFEKSFTDWTVTMKG